jgi:Fe-S oxidoreductase
MSQNNTTQVKVNIPLVAEMAAEGKTPDFLFWVGSAGSYDDRAKKISKAFAKILAFAGVDFAILGAEETDSGESAKRAGSEFIFQMQALQNIELLNTYGIKNIVTCDPHDFSILKNEYADLGGVYEVWHHTQFLQKLMDEGKIKVNTKVFANKKVSFHDPCYLGRGNGEYEAPRFVLQSLGANFQELDRNRERSFCCGAGGAQMFKEAEKGDREVFVERTDEVLKMMPDVVCTACPFCMVMLTDGIKYKDMKDKIQVLDIAEIVASALGL